MIARRLTSSPLARSWQATSSARATSRESAWRSAPRSAASRERRPRAMPPPRSIPVALVEEGSRMASICNACRYCEGFCAVFPALERRLSFAEGDLAYLANLCHDCGSCYYACQYAPPHEFQLNFPKMLADIRLQTYRKYAWPGPLSALFQRNGMTVGLVAAASLALFLLVTTFAIDRSVFFAPHPDREGSFYAVIPHRTMAWTF